MIRVLHIDDEAPIRLLARVNLEAEGMELIEAVDGRTGIALAQEEQPQLILLNVNLPGMVGWRVAETLTADQRTKEIPIVFLTARAAFRDRIRGFDLGALDYITKPFNPLELAPRLREMHTRLERGERDALRHERIIEMFGLRTLGRVAPAADASATAPLSQAEAVAELDRLAAAPLDTPSPFVLKPLARDLLGHLLTLRLPRPALDPAQEQALRQAGDDVRRDASEGERADVDAAARELLEPLCEDEWAAVCETLSALIVTAVRHVFERPAEPVEQTEDRRLIRLVAVLYVLLALDGALRRRTSDA